MRPEEIHAQIKIKIKPRRHNTQTASSCEFLLDEANRTLNRKTEEQLPRGMMYRAVVCSTDVARDTSIDPCVREVEINGSNNIREVENGGAGWVCGIVLQERPVLRVGRHFLLMARRLCGIENC